MYQCQNCQKKFQKEPLIAITDQGVYCSEECFPEDALDHPYSFEYISLVYAYREFEQKKREIESYDDRVDLENEMEEVIENYQSYYLGDSEGLFYKEKLLVLFEKLLQLYDEVHNIFLNREEEVYYSVTIFWDDVGGANEEVCKEIKERLLKKQIFYQNLHWEARDEAEIGGQVYKDVICFDTEEERDEMLHEIRGIFKAYYPHLDEDDIEYIVYPQRIKQCPVCLHWEAEEDFVFDQERNVNVCNQWDYCRGD